MIGPKDKSSAVKKDVKTCSAHIHEIPHNTKDNEFILTGYRLGHKTYCDVFMTCFKCHNETFNVWSHFLGKLMFLSFVVVVLVNYPNESKVASYGVMENFDSKLDANQSLTMN